MNKVEQLNHTNTTRARGYRTRSAYGTFTLLLLLFAGAAAGLAGAQPAQTAQIAQIETDAAKDSSSTRHQGWEVRYGQAAAPATSTPLSSLIGKAESFAIEVVKHKDEATGESRLYGTGEAHGVFDVPMEAALAIVLDYPNIKDISPRVKDVKVLETTGSRLLVYEDIGINFMGISIGYKLDVEVYSDQLPGGALGMRARLIKSHDAKLYASDSSWYFQRVEIDGKTYTYMRTWSSSGLRNPGLGVAGVMKLFTAGELKDQIEAVAKLAAKR
ncbi:MAG: hypothetical protein RBT73_04915 [Spirochaetia bacterium]|nr:hypothetical protein [Spirochaetia bacterium]